MGSASDATRHGSSQAGRRQRYARAKLTGDMDQVRSSGHLRRLLPQVTLLEPRLTHPNPDGPL